MRWPGLALLLVLVVPVMAQDASSVRIKGDRLSGVVLPIEPVPGDIEIRALRTWAWTVDDTKRLVLEGDVTVTIGGQRLVADEAVLWLNRIPSADGLINQVAVYFDEVTNPVQEAGIGVHGRRLLVTGSARGRVRLSTSAKEDRRPRLSTIVRQGETRLADHLRRIVAGVDVSLEQRPQVVRLEPPDAFVPVPGGRVTQEDIELPDRVLLPVVEQDTPALLSPSTMVRFSAGVVEVVPDTEESVVTATGRLVVDYYSTDPGDDFTQITLSAERGVIFTDPGTLEEMADTLDAESVRGVYLEGDVLVTAEDGDYVARAPRVYYDFRTNQAIMLEAVLRTYLRESNIPVYARALEMRQIAANQWQAKKVRVSTSEFHTPHLAIGAEQMLITRQPARADPLQRETFLVSEGNTVLAGDVPIAWWPKFAGTARDIPLKGVTVGYEDDDGARIETRWDLIALLGRAPLRGVDAELKLDGFTKRGAAVGLELTYDVGASEGNVDLYLLSDDGEDKTSSGRRVEQDSSLRGVALLEHQTQLTRDWSFQAQGSFISDESFITTWREDDFKDRREYETSASLKHQRGNSALTMLARYELQDFISNDYLLASRQTQVDKVPEFSLRWYGGSLFDESITYSAETRLTRMRFVFESSTPDELGVRGRAFGIDDDDPIGDSLRAAGLSQKWVNRLDTRHELSAPGNIGPVQVTPYAVGRITAYSDDFEEFSSDADDNRFFGTLGVRLSTELQRIDDTAYNRIFDINRLRHIVEPAITVWYGYTTVDADDLPAYDPDIETLNDGAAVNLALRNTWQTQRGGPGRWRSVDFLKLDADVTLTSSEADRQHDVPQFFDYRPEYSQWGDNVRASMAWLLSDSLSVVGEQIIDIDDSRIARGSIGTELRHHPTLATHVEYRYIDASDNQLLGVGWNYQMTPVYKVVLRPEWDFREDEFRSILFRVIRSFPDFDLTVQVKHDEIKDETSLGASIDLVEF